MTLPSWSVEAALGAACAATAWLVLLLALGRRSGRETGRVLWLAGRVGAFAAMVAGLLLATVGGAGALGGVAGMLVAGPFFYAVALLTGVLLGPPDPDE